MVWSVTMLTCLLLLAVSGVSTALTEAELQQKVSALAERLLQQRLYTEERVRSEGDSGVKQATHGTDGTRPYQGESHVGETSLLDMHDHSDYQRKIGLGQFVAVMNGVEFRTKHADYYLRMPHVTSGGYHQTSDIPLPSVPTEVTQIADVDGQVEEMQKWFQAWRDQDYSVRDYRDYFKPVLCYLEAAWTDPSEMDSSTGSTDWNELQEKEKFISQVGFDRDRYHTPYLPVTVINTDAKSGIDLAQWNYRTLCHPIHRDVSLNELHMIREIAPCLAHNISLSQHEKTKRARFQLGRNLDGQSWTDRKEYYGLLDELMADIPGKDNYAGSLLDEAFGEVMYTYKTNPSAEAKTVLNSAYYHRWQRAAVSDAMGKTARHRAFADQNIFMAMTTQSKVKGMSPTKCASDSNCADTQKWSYAIPMEIIYLTPLLTWNPYGLHYRDDINYEDGRTGSTSDTAKSFDNIGPKRFFQTPENFFADRATSVVGVVDESGIIRKVSASGTRIFLPNISGVGAMRTRYPIMPVHGEGSAAWKEMEALKDVILNPEKYKQILKESIITTSAPSAASTMPCIGIFTVIHIILILIVAV